MAFKKYAKKKTTKKGTSSKLVKTVNWLVKREKQEDNEPLIKRLSGNLSTDVNSANPLISLLNGMVQGTNDGDRIGDKVKNQYLELNIDVLRSATSAEVECKVRVLIIREKTCLGSALAMVQYFHNTLPLIYDVRNRETRDLKRYVTYYDKTFDLGPQKFSNAVTSLWHATAPSRKILKIRKKMSFTTNYSRSNVGSVADIDTGSLYLVVITDLIDAGDIHVNISGHLMYHP